MGRIYYLILIFLISEFQSDLVSASKSSEEISAIIQSYADAFTTVTPDETQRVTTQIYPSIEVLNREYAYDLTKAKNKNETVFSNKKPISSEEFSSISVQESNESEELEGPADHDSSFSKHESSQAFTTIVPEEMQHITTQLYPTTERQNKGYGHSSTEVKYDNNAAFSNTPLNAAASNQYTSFNDFLRSSSEESNESYESRGPAYHVIPFSEHEIPRESSTRPNYTAPGAWAKPPPDKNIPLDFLPTKLLAQVRDSHTVRHVPREYGIESAETNEEEENAARLKEVLKESKANTIYTEEGYEDAAYDHAGHIRDADFQEDFARKLNEELERNKSYSGKNEQPKTYKNYKPRKHKDHSHSNIAQNDEKPKVTKGVRKSKQKISPKHYRLLKHALNQPVMNPKNAVESGIVQLEKDLRNEYREGQRTSTEPYAYTTIASLTTFKPSATESIFQSKMDFETTTMRHNVFTIRPRKTFVTVTPKPHRNKLKKPLNAFSISPNIDNYNAFTTSSYNREPTPLPSTMNYGKLVWGYVRQNQNATPTITYPPPHFEPQPVNPLAVATVNGHGPYLVVVTAPPETFTSSPSESKNFISTVGYDAAHDYNITQPIVVDSNVHHNTLIPVNRKANRVNYSNEPQAVHTNTDVSKPVSYKRDTIRHREKKLKSPKLKAQPLSEGYPNYIEGNRDSYMEYYTTLQSSKNPNMPITYSNYNRQLNANWFNQWPNIFDNANPVENYGLNSISSIESQKLRGPPVVTRLLAPAPLSTSEYATFQRQNREIKSMTPSVIEMLPIIDAIHKHEHEQNSFPFLFRRKRSTFGFFRPPNFQNREQKDRKTDKTEDLSQNSNKSSNVKYPSNFQSLLNESPNVAAKEINDEIKKRFKNGTKAFPDKESSPEELSSYKKTPVNSKENFKRREIIEVQVPALDFTSVFERDKIESTTQEPRVDTKKYPFYTDSSALRNTALKYIVNPKEIPKKTLGGMEFYNSRVLECEEVNPDLEKIIPEDEELANKRGSQKKKSRLRGLGDKIDCYKAKYFDETPFDNPLFIEKDVEMPPPPTELNPKAFASRILQLSREKEEYAILKGPKNPEFVNIKREAKVRRPSRHHLSELKIRQHLYPKIRKPNLVNINSQRYRHPSKNSVNIDGRIKPPETRSKTKIKANNIKGVPRYQRLVYEDVMGNIMNLDKSKKSYIPKRGVAPMYSKHYKKDNTREQGLSGFKKLNTVTIDGLVPPPQKIGDKLVNNMLRYNFTEGLTKNLRIYKRSIFLKDSQNLSSEETNNNSNANRKDKDIFRIVFTTPAPRKTLFEKEIQNPDKINGTVARKQNTFIHTPRHSNRSEADSGRYGKFLTNKKINSTTVTRRKEPKYNVAQKFIFPNRTSITYGDSTFASSTLIPVIVNLYENFTSRIPTGSKNNQAKKQVAEETDYDKQSDKSKEVDDGLDSLNEHEEDPKKQFVVFDHIQSKNKNKSNGNVVTTNISTADLDNYKELAEFLKGNPPGYDESFVEEDDHTYDKKKALHKVEDEYSELKGLPKDQKFHDDNLEVQESVNNEENNDENPESQTEDTELEERKKDTYGEESSTDDSLREAEENEQSNDDGEEKSSNDTKQENKSFIRFSSRPDSPPESFEDERYADLGPRVNKPYFYHPPFDIPTYEKYALGKSIHDDDGNDYGHETEYHEKYVFPWEQDNEKDENKKESEHYSALDRHEFPWEKRERQEKERQKREKMHKKYAKKNVAPIYNTDSYGKASNIELVYTPYKNKYLRGKKDVNALQSDPENHAVKFSSKYKSAKIKDLLTDEKSKGDVEKSIIKTFKSIDISTPKDESTYRSPRKSVKDIDGSKIAPDTSSKNTDALIMDSNKQKALNTSCSSIEENLGRINRSRGRIRRVNTKNHVCNETALFNITNLPQVKPTLSPKTTRQRGRNRSNATILTTTTTTTTAKPNIRKRSRQVFTTTTSRTTPKSINEKRKRAFRITSYTGSNTESTTQPTLFTSTGRTVEREHRSRVSKEMIITKTVEDDDGDDQDEEFDISSHGNKKSPSKVVKPSHSKIRHRQKTKNIPDSENPMKTERVEKVTITMEETPDHVYETKEIDKDGIKGKFITITANNNSAKAEPTKRSRSHTTVDDAEMEEMQRRMEAFKSFDSVIQDTEALDDEPSSLRTAEKYIVGSLLQKLPLPLSRKFSRENEDYKAKNNNDEDKDEDENKDESEDDDSVDDNKEEADENDDQNSDTEDSRDIKVDEKISRSNNAGTIEKNSSVIKDPNNRNYYYVETL